MARRPGAAAALAAGMLVVLAPPLASAERPQPVKVTAEAWYTAETSDALPPILVEEFPPGIACLVVPESCRDETRPITDPVEQHVTGLEVPAGPVQPVAPDTMPVGLLGGHPRYASLLRFELPQGTPADAFVESFQLTLHEDGPTYALESPAFRELVRALVTQAADDPSPDPFERFVERVASQDAKLLETEPTGLEVCAVLGEWRPVENGDMATLPELDCAFGANGARDDDGVWTFDLTTTVQAWLDGTIPNNGIYIGPVTPANLEYGDPDTSSNFQISLAGGAARDADLRPAAIFTVGEQPSSASAGGAPAPALAPPVGSPMGPATLPQGDSATAGGAAPEAAGSVPAAQRKPVFPAAYWALMTLAVLGVAAFGRAVGLEGGAAARAPGAMSRLVGAREQ